jgi:hypothetical protein
MRTVMVAEYGSVERRGAFRAVRHGSEDVRGRNVVWAPAEDLCAREAACAWCDALRARVQSRTGTVG